MNKAITIGSRESRLAVIQAELIIAQLRKSNPNLNLRLITMKTEGDRLLDQTLDSVGGKGLFVKELDQALLDGRIDLAVHSLKDMPAEAHPELPILAYSKREDPADVLVLPAGALDIDPDQSIGSSSARRKAQLETLFPELHTAHVRGNVLTRLQKLDEGQYGALVLAAAGLNRLGLSSRISRRFTYKEMIPAAGQGILAVQGKKGRLEALTEQLNDADAKTAALAERSLIAALGCGCTAPVAAYAEMSGGSILLNAFYLDENTGRKATGNIRGNRLEAEKLGRELAKRLTNEVKA